jgi:hypothetical protein
MDILLNSPQFKLLPMAWCAKAIRYTSPLILSIALSSLYVPFIAQAQSHIRIAGGTPIDRKYLSAGSEGDYLDLFNRDDGSGRQRWFIETPPQRWFMGGRKPSYVHIRVAGGTPPKRLLLSATLDGEIVDLFAKDDGEGRQRWFIEQQPGGYVHIRISGGTPEDRRLLGANSNGSGVELTDKDDGSGRQRWIIDTAPPMPPPPPPPPAQPN